jgi:lambda family phage portal protein
MGLFDMLATGVDSYYAKFKPETALKRAQAKRALALYEAAKPTTLRKQSRDSTAGNMWVQNAGNNLRNQARYLDANHDLAKGVLNTLVNNIVGANGIGIEPQPRGANGEIDEKLADQLLKYFKDWCEFPEVTGTYDWASAQRAACRTWIRDGEMIAKDLVGNVNYLDHGSQVKYSIEMLEPDFLPLWYTDYDKKIIQGIQVNAWGRPVLFHLYKEHPGEINTYSTTGSSQDLKAVSFDLINHLVMRERLGQLRGVSIFASVMTRMDDIKDYEESERIAAKIAASMCAYVKKGNPDQYEFDIDGTPRELNFRPGMIFDNLATGESIDFLDPKRPNTALVDFRKGQLKAVAVGTNTNYSTIARDYDGSYSSQRQELIEGYTNYQALSSEFINGFIKPIWKTFVKMAVAQGLVTVPRGIDSLSLDDALYISPSIPWIDGLKEVQWNNEAERSLFISGPEIIRKTGKNPRDVVEQELRWRKMLKDKGLVNVADPENDPLLKAAPQQSNTDSGNQDTGSKKNG